MLREVAAIVPRSGPIGVRDLADDFAAFFDGLEHGADVEALAEGVLDADFDVVEVDKNSDVQTFLLQSQTLILLVRRKPDTTYVVSAFKRTLMEPALQASATTRV